METKQIDDRIKRLETKIGFFHFIFWLYVWFKYIIPFGIRLFEYLYLYGGE